MKPKRDGILRTKSFIARANAVSFSVHFRLTVKWLLNLTYTLPGGPALGKNLYVQDNNYKRAFVPEPCKGHHDKKPKSIEKKSSNGNWMEKICREKLTKLIKSSLHEIGAWRNEYSRKKSNKGSHSRIIITYESRLSHALKRAHDLPLPFQRAWALAHALTGFVLFLFLVVRTSSLHAIATRPPWSICISINWAIWS